MMEPTQAPSPDPNSSTSTTSLPLRPKLQSNETSDKVFRAEQENMSDAEHDTAERNADLANAIIETGKKKKKKSKSRGSKTKVCISICVLIGSWTLYS